MSRKYPHILLYQPAIHDFAAYDFWYRPLGLLTLATVLREMGCTLSLLDCLDRHHPVLSELTFDRPAGREDGTGKFYRQIIDKPEILSFVPRHYARYGLSPEAVEHLLSSQPEPDLILVSSTMTYWYPAVEEGVNHLRRVFPGVPLWLGGIYATLCPDHARETIQPTRLVLGEGIAAVLEWAREHGGDYRSLAQTDPCHIRPAWDLVPHLETMALRTSIGCPFRCSVCASHRLGSQYRRRSPDEVLSEMDCWMEQRTELRHVCIYDDAFLLQPAQHARPLLNEWARRFPDIRLHLPNGIHPRKVDQELADSMAAAHVDTVRLSFETVDPVRQRDMDSKVNGTDLEDALCCLERAGYPRFHIGVYVLMGLADQDLTEVLNSVRFVHDRGAQVQLASFSPIPGTREYEKAVGMGLLRENTDPVLCNNSIFPLWSQTLGYSVCQEFTSQVKNENRRLVQRMQQTVDSFRPYQALSGL